MGSDLALVFSIGRQRIPRCSGDFTILKVSICTRSAAGHGWVTRLWYSRSPNKRRAFAAAVVG
ncbi:hypothetical protein [Saccharopolyspora shandongensis]|uniref:hypothetical protein n=1 Tax=Saccharopolyspora shandongensis TaxID=418495 RepID=UPI0033DCCB29